MHPHLHREDSLACEDLMNALEECHAKGFMHKATGGCNDKKEKLMACIRSEREKKAALNREAARQRKEKLKKFKEEGIQQ